MFNSIILIAWVAWITHSLIINCLLYPYAIKSVYLNNLRRVYLLSWAIWVVPHISYWPMTLTIELDLDIIQIHPCSRTGPFSCPFSWLPKTPFRVDLLKCTKGVVVYYRELGGGVGNFGPEFSKKITTPLSRCTKICNPPIQPACRNWGSVSSQVFEVVEDAKMTFSR